MAIKTTISHHMAGMVDLVVEVWSLSENAPWSSTLWPKFDFQLRWQLRKFMCECCWLLCHKGFTLGTRGRKGLGSRERERKHGLWSKEQRISHSCLNMLMRNWHSSLYLLDQRLPFLSLPSPVLLGLWYPEYKSFILVFHWTCFVRTLECSELVQHK